MNNAKSILQTLNLVSNSSQLNTAKKLVCSFFMNLCSVLVSKENKTDIWNKQIFKKVFLKTLLFTSYVNPKVS